MDADYYLAWARRACYWFLQLAKRPAGLKMPSREFMYARPRLGWAAVLP
jgi:hypothetical protein